MSQQEGVLNQKLNILKAALIEERKKTSLLQTDISNLNDELEIQKQIIARLQAESNNKALPANEPLMNLFTEDGKVKELSKSKDEQIISLTKENTALNTELATLKSVKDNLDIMLSDMIKQYAQLKESTDTQLQELHQHNEAQLKDLHKKYESSSQSHSEDSKRLETMASMISKLEMQKNELKTENDLLLKALYKKEEGYQTSFEDQNDEIAQLRQQVEELSKANKELNEYIDEISPITINTVFKGVRIINDDPKETRQIEICFGEIKKCLVVREEKENGKVFNLEQIKKLVKIKPNRIKFTFCFNNNEIVYLIEFVNEEYLHYIEKFYNEGTFKTKLVENLKISLSLDDYSG